MKWNDQMPTVNKTKYGKNNMVNTNGGGGKDT